MLVLSCIVVVLGLVIPGTVPGRWVGTSSPVIIGEAELRSPTWWREAMKTLRS
jgi:hypothetical protein